MAGGPLPAMGSWRRAAGEVLGSVGPGPTSGSRGDDLAGGRKGGVISIMGVPEPQGWEREKRAKGRSI